jgi:anti-sigma regulatory factor (Ser/Thr protein kinase)
MRGFPISEQSEILHMRREAEALAKGLGFSPEDRGRLAIVATELGTNLLKHAGHGEILLGLSENASVPCVEVIALDQGPGMADVEGCLVDGYSTAGSQGTGLGAAKRQATSFDIYSGLDLGAAVHVRVCPSKTEFKPRDAIPWAVLWRAMPGEECCGDGFAVRTGTDEFLGMVADGLGHGAFAAQASEQAVRIFEKSSVADPDSLLENLHLGLRATRGAAVSVAKIEQSRGLVTFSGVGNVAGALIVGGQVKRMVPRNGTVGAVARHIMGFQYPFKGEALVVLHTDGLAGNWSLDKYPGLAQREPALIAAVLYRDFGRRRDDALILVVRAQS